MFGFDGAISGFPAGGLFNRLEKADERGPLDRMNIDRDAVSKDLQLTRCETTGTGKRSTGPPV